ncbi:hypothetical protein [Emticicia fluvialis]|uniref:hypothetical protein n=1 Tax=Emticicia fluvialis TaxID=2974474 RepID=UPI0021660B58|nr:hypothetical protein [Emticicia fluvialis]
MQTRHLERLIVETIIPAGAMVFYILPLPIVWPKLPPASKPTQNQQQHYQRLIDTANPWLLR